MHYNTLCYSLHCLDVVACFACSVVSRCWIKMTPAVDDVCSVLLSDAVLSCMSDNAVSRVGRYCVPSLW